MEALPNPIAKALADGQRFERAFTVNREAVNAEARTVELAFASETPYERYWGIEILDCSASSMRTARLNSGANLLLEHDSDDVVGVVESVSIGPDRVARAIVRFGKSADAEEVFQDVLDGIRRNVSVGYMIHEAVMVEESDGVATYRVTDWEPFEVSLVAIPADPNVGVGRSMTAPEEPKSLEKVVMENTAQEPVVTVVEQRNHAKEIGDISSKFPGSADIALKSIQAGHTVEQFQQELLRSQASKPLPTADVGLTPKETQRFSVLRAIRALVDRDWTHAGFEREASQAVLKRMGMSEAPNGGFIIPYEVQQRDLTAGTPNAGGYLVATDNLASSFIDLLRNRTVTGQLGATHLSGLVGNVTIPKQTAAATGYWLASEATAITETQQTFGQLSLAPKHVGAYTEISRQLMLQSNPSADNLVMNDLARVIAIAIDSAVISGSGASGQPTGIKNTGGIGSVASGSITYAKVLEFQTDVAGSNALAANCAYLTDPATAAVLMQKQRFTSTDSPLWIGSVLDGTVSGFRAMATLQMAAGDLLFGDFSQVVIADWGALEIALNPYANFPAAISGVRAIQTCDVGVRIPGAFSLATGVTA